MKLNIDQRFLWSETERKKFLSTIEKLFLDTFFSSKKYQKKYDQQNWCNSINLLPMCRNMIMCNQEKFPIGIFITTPFQGFMGIT